MDHFYYFVDGDMVTSFEPLLAHYGSGSGPDRFVPQMRLAGLSVEPPPDDGADQHSDSAGPERDPRIALLEMLTLALGIRLPARWPSARCAPCSPARRSNPLPRQAAGSRCLPQDRLICCSRDRRRNIACPSGLPDGRRAPAQDWLGPRAESQATGRQSPDVVCGSVRCGGHRRSRVVDLTMACSRESGTRVQWFAMYAY